MCSKIAGPVVQYRKGSCVSRSTPLDLILCISSVRKCIFLSEGDIKTPERLVFQVEFSQFEGRLEFLLRDRSATQPKNARSGHAKMLPFSSGTVVVEVYARFYNMQ